MLVYPQRRVDVAGEGCRVPRWMPAERLAPYFARAVVLPTIPPQVEDEDSSGGSSPDRSNDGVDEVNVCGWRGCGARFGSVGRLSAHVARGHAHAHSDGLFYCNWKGCARPQRGFNARYKMLVHVRTHTNERPHTCNQCNKSFSRAENLKIHLRSHSGEKPYICPYEGCGKAYSNSSDRFKHTRTHTVDKPYCCKVPGCNKRYTDPSSLRKHVKTYKHFNEPKKTEEVHSPEIYSPTRENNSSYNNIEPNSSIRLTYKTPLTPYVCPEPVPLYPVEQVTYVRPIETYPMRVPSHEMSYLEYTQMYEHAYRSYYSSGISYPIIRPTVDEKVYSYDDVRIDDVTMVENDSPDYAPIDEDVPLNLICAKRIECKPIEELVRIRDLPLDLSTKS